MTNAEKAEEIRNAYELKLKELQEYSYACEVAVKKPVGLLGKTCPECKQRLKLVKHSFNPAFMTGFQLWEWNCKCGYRFVTEKDLR